MKNLYFLIIILLISLTIPFIFNMSYITEGYSNYNLEQSSGFYPSSQTNVLVQNTYPPIGKNQISDNNASDIWWHYPVQPLGTFKQITNNIRYPDNPDEGTCMPASMCGALYHDKHTGTNTIHTLPPVNPNCGTRIGYFTSNEQLIDSLPFRTDMQNILY